MSNYSLGAGAAYGTAKSGAGIAGVGTFRPDLIMKARNNRRPGRRCTADSCAVSYPRYHVRYSCGILASYIRSYRPRPCAAGFRRPL